MSFATDILWPVIQDMGTGLGSFMGLNLTDVLRTPQDFSPQTASLMSTISVLVVQPVATTVLVVLFVMELWRISMRVEGDSESFLKIAFFTLVKFALVKWAFDNTATIMGGLYQLFADMAVDANITVTQAAAVDQTTVTAFLDSVDRMDWLGQTLLVVLMLLAWLVNKGAVIIALALVVMRFVKLYIFTAFAPMPMAFFASQETRSFAIGFLRNFAATVLQALVLVLAFAIYHAISDGWAARAFEDLDENAVAAALSIGGNYIFMGVVLGMVMFGSGRIANELLGN